MTYAGRFKGTTLNANDPKMKIIFPAAPAFISSMFTQPDEAESA
jgi:hypothetical protein